MRASSAPLVSALGKTFSVEGFAEVVPPSELVANGLGDVVSNAVGSVLGACNSAAAPAPAVLAPLAVVLGASVTAGTTGPEGWLFPCGALAGVDGSDFAGAGGLGLAFKLDRHCINSRPRMATSTS